MKEVAEQFCYVVNGSYITFTDGDGETGVNNPSALTVVGRIRRLVENVLLRETKKVDMQWRGEFEKVTNTVPFDAESVASTIECLIDGAKRDRDKQWIERLKWIVGSEPVPAGDNELSSLVVELVQPIDKQSKAEQQAFDLKIAEWHHERDIITGSSAGRGYVTGYEDASIDISACIRGGINPGDRVNEQPTGSAAARSI